jgi:hypothetical protein
MSLAVSPYEGRLKSEGLCGAFLGLQARGCDLPPWGAKS